MSTTTTRIAFAPMVRIEALAGAYRVYCPSGAMIGQADLVRGFARYYGAKGSAHEGVTATVRGGLTGLEVALAGGLRDGRDDSA